MQRLRFSLMVVLSTVLSTGSNVAWLSIPIAHAASGSPLILSVSETVMPGNTMDIFGGGFTLTSSVSLQLIQPDGTPDPSQNRTLVVANQSAYLVQAVAPGDMPSGLWAAVVHNPDGSTSAPKYVHQARGNGYDNQEVSAGSAMRVWGRNMVAPGGDYRTSYVTFTGGNTVLKAAATTADPYSMSIIVPASVQVGTSYTVKVSNGLGGSTGENIVPYPLTIRTGGADPFALGVPWGADFAPFASNVYDVTSDSRLTQHAIGDGTTNNFNAVQAAMDAASRSGGGVVYFPSGTYLIDNSSNDLNVRSKVVLQGAGKLSTTLKYGTNPSAGRSFALLDNAGKIGFEGMTIQDMNTSTVTVNGILALYAARTSEVFFKDIAYLLGTAFTYGISCNCDKAIMTGSSVTSKAGYGGAIGFTGSDIEISNNTVINGGGRNTFYADNITIEHNTFHRDGSLDYPQKNEDGVIEASFSRNLHLIGNDIENLPPFDATDFSYGSNDVFMTQSSVYPSTLLGSVTSATPATITDSSSDWSNRSTIYPFYHPSLRWFDRAMVAITNGKGLGQLRDIVSNDTHTLTVDHPWEILPDSTSSYVITNLTADRFVVQGNTFANDKAGMLFANGLTDSVVDGNTLNHTAGIALYGITSTSTRPVVSDVVWGNSIINNTLTGNPNSTNPPTIYVGPAMFPPDTEINNNIALDNEVRNNTITAQSPPVSGGIGAAGYYNYAYTGGGVYYGAHTIPLIGSIFEGNVANGASAKPYSTLGTSQSTYHYAGESTVQPCLNLKLTDRPAGNQAIPGVQVKYFKTGTEELDARTENWPSLPNGMTILNDPFLTSLQQGQAAAYPMRFRDLGTYDVWVKAPGYLAKKITAITNVQTQCVPMPTGLLAGDFTTNDQNTVTIGDLVTAIRSYKGGTDDAANLATTAFGHVPTFGNLITVIRHFNQNPVGDQP